MKNLVLGTMSLVLLVSVANADVVLEDDFLGTGLGATVWTAQGSVTVADSKVSLGGQSMIQTADSSAPSSGEITIHLTKWNSPYTGGVYVGFRDATDSNVINIMTNHTSGTIDLSMRKDGGVWQGYSIPMYKNMSVFFQEDWTMTISATSVTLQHDIDGWMTPFDTGTQTPDGGGTWAIPTAEMSFYVQTGWASSSTSLDKVTISQVPEPVTTVLLIAGAPAALLRRRKNS